MMGSVVMSLVKAQQGSNDILAALRSPLLPMFTIAGLSFDLFVKEGWVVVLACLS